MKKIALVLIFLFLLFPAQAHSQNDYKPVLFLTSESKQVVAGQPATVTLVLNTLGNKVQNMDVTILIGGNAAPNTGFSYILNQGKADENFDIGIYREEDYPVYYKKEFYIRFNSTATDGVNWGSEAVPMLHIRFVPNESGTITAAIKDSTTIWYQNQKVPFEIYSPYNKPYTITVLQQPTPSPTPTTAPRATPTSTAKPTPTPTVAPTPNYNQEFQELKNEIANLKTKVSDQEERLTLIERIVINIQNFFSKLFGRR